MTQFDWFLSSSKKKNLLTAKKYLVKESNKIQRHPKHNGGFFSQPTPSFTMFHHCRRCMNLCPCNLKHRLQAQLSKQAPPPRSAPDVSEYDGGRERIYKSAKSVALIRMQCGYYVCARVRVRAQKAFVV